ncbi:NAD-dependent protein deacylase sirtuin-5, mitochondrial-like isoform X2 [Harmonia axyridis]|uniref:NAD-dependent protein deacylase sirtuin-5, mitochondrial-like isoform X2 n=1 Tax=Harmonia axyridis TaxID=115357 RepID=UPI001E27541E|nr:NAD-dependent protein deacylase sirtuin-5, mitochondrial-like isoform X2 [Harmonia axyridis]
MFSSNFIIELFKMPRKNKKNIKFISNYALFRKVADDAQKIVVLTGAGISAESGIPVFRGSVGLWRTYNAKTLATPNAFANFPSLVWQFYSYRREVAFNAEPNKAHLALAKYEEKCIREKRKFSIITQNVDGLHHKAGSKKVIELHGTLRKVKCTKCSYVYENLDVPICEALRGLGSSESLQKELPIVKVEDLPKCIKCNSLLRPFIVWFGEYLDPEIMEEYRRLVEESHLIIVIGTSFMAHPIFVQTIKAKCVPVAEFNINECRTSEAFKIPLKVCRLGKC